MLILVRFIQFHRQSSLDAKHGQFGRHFPEPFETFDYYSARPVIDEACNDLWPPHQKLSSRLGGRIRPRVRQVKTILRFAWVLWCITPRIVPEKLSLLPFPRTTWPYSYTVVVSLLRWGWWFSYICRRLTSVSRNILLFFHYALSVLPSLGLLHFGPFSFVGGTRPCHLSLPFPWVVALFFFLQSAGQPLPIQHPLACVCSCVGVHSYNISLAA